MQHGPCGKLTLSADGVEKEQFEQVDHTPVIEEKGIRQSHYEREVPFIYKSHLQYPSITYCRWGVSDDLRSNFISRLHKGLCGQLAHLTLPVLIRTHRDFARPGYAHGSSCSLNFIEWSPET